jgi:4-hydroxybenzoate polyprenyltransferase
MKSPMTTLASWSYVAKRELEITHRLLSSNASASCGNFVAIILPRLLVAPVLHEPLLLLVRFSFAVFSSAYGFDICQQTTSVDEDKVNRPSRPVPSGVISFDGAVRRWYLSWTLAPVVMAAIGSLRLSFDLICTFTWVYFCYVWPRPRDWFFKSLFSAICQVCFLQTSKSLILLHAPRSEASCSLDVTIVLWIMATIHIQDFQDVDGDRKIGRTTLPAILNPPALVLVRRLTTAILWSFATISSVIGIRHSDGWLVPLFAAVQFVGAAATGLRMLRTESLAQAETTYKMFYVPTGLATIAYLSFLINDV